MSKEEADRRLAEDIAKAKKVHAKRLQEIKGLNQTLGSPKAASDKLRKQIFDMRRSGMKFREIAEALSITTASARNRFLTADGADRRKRRLDDPFDQLSVRSRNALHNALDGDLTFENVSKLTRKKILDVPNAGFRSLKEIESFLATMGLALSDDPVNN